MSRVSATDRVSLLDRRQIFCRRFSVPSIFQIERNFLTFVQRRHSGALDGRNMNKRIFSAVIRLDEPKSLGRVKPFHSTCRHRIFL
jgi:hypothetical protein